MWTNICEQLSGYVRRRNADKNICAIGERDVRATGGEMVILSAANDEMRRSGPLTVGVGVW